MNNAAVAEHIPLQGGEHQEQFVPQIVRRGIVITVDREKLRLKLNPNVWNDPGQRRASTWKSVDDRIHLFRIVGEGLETFECEVFEWGETLSVREIVSRLSSKDPEDPWQAARFEHLASFSENISIPEQGEIIAAVGEFAVSFEQPRPVHNGTLDESSQDICVPILFNASPFKMLQTVVVGQGNPAEVNARLPKSFKVLAVRKIR